MRTSLSGRVVVVSPHVDDAVLSLGATIARATGSGAHVKVLTVFAGNPSSSRPAEGWDTRGGFATEGESAAVRREEDRAACLLLGAEPLWLPFSLGAYLDARDDDVIWSGIADAVTDADAALVPGFPLSNQDHAWLSRLVVERGLPSARLGLYAEQPYRYRVRSKRRQLEVPAQLRRAVPSGIEWMRTTAQLSDYWLKRKAILAYVSQMALLFPGPRHRRRDLMLLHEVLHRGEALAWLSR